MSLRHHHPPVRGRARQASANVVEDIEHHAPPSPPPVARVRARNREHSPVEYYQRTPTRSPARRDHHQRCRRPERSNQQAHSPVAGAAFIINITTTSGLERNVLALLESTSDKDHAALFGGKDTRHRHHLSPETNSSRGCAAPLETTDVQ
ncbi:hypothetical protein QAD02_002085 [Eretmocerus hayati]|uniref:Uncharacterized protein n=1 Tax=Eretmocerus hayati TaxID=131215 RepID=A0ACC2NJM0_9HYME|nr:hypothetical protein QAD02_002085 [Eretmocerus hayati]